MSGLLEAFSAAMAGGSKSMVDDLEGQIADARAQALYSAKRQIDDTYDMAREQRQSEQHREDATWAADEAERRDDEKKRKLSGLLQSEIDKSNGEGGPGGYDPKAYKNMDEEGQAEFELKALGRAGELPVGREQEFRLGRHDKAAALESKNALLQFRADIAQQLATGKLSEQEAHIRLLEAQAKFNEAKADGKIPSGSGGGGGNKANETLQFKIDLLKKAGMSDQAAALAVMRQNLTSGDAAKIVAKMDPFAKKEAYPGMSDSQIISELSSAGTTPAPAAGKTIKYDAKGNRL